MSRKKRIVHEDETFKVMNLSANGSKQPRKIVIAAAPTSEGRRERILELSVDELFTLTEILDDLCDEIEDEEAREKNNA